MVQLDVPMDGGRFRLCTIDRMAGKLSTPTWPLHSSDTTSVCNPSAVSLIHPVFLETHDASSSGAAGLLCYFAEVRCPT